MVVCLYSLFCIWINRQSIVPRNSVNRHIKCYLLQFNYDRGDQMSYWCNMARVFLFNFCANLYFQMVVEWLTLLEVTNFWSIYNFKIVSCFRLVVIFLTFLLLITEYEFGGVYTGYFSQKLNMTQDYLSFA